MSTCDEVHSPANNDLTDIPDIPDEISSKDSAASTFSQVIFPDISDYFPPGKNVRVTYILTTSLEPSSRDWIGLFTVGWTSAREYLTFIWAPKLNSDNPKDRTVTVEFSAYYLPNDKNEFYQFCYVTKQGHIRGASTPFQFRNLMECDQLVEVEDESGMIVLKTKTAAMEEELDRITTQKEKLESKITELESEKATLSKDLIDIQEKLQSAQIRETEKEEHCKELEATITTLKEKMEKVNEEIKHANENLAKQKSELDNAAFAIGKLVKETLGMKEEVEKATTAHEKEISSLNEQIDSKAEKLTESECLVNDLTEKLKKLELKTNNLQQKDSQLSSEIQQSIDGLTKERDDAEVKASRYREERDLFKDQFAHSEEARRDIMQNQATLKKKIHAKDEEIVSKYEKVLALEEKSKMLRNELKEAAKQAVVQKSATESQLGNVEDKLNACEASKRLISTELTEARDRRDKLMSELHQAKKERDHVTLQLESSQRQLAEFEKNFYEMKERAERADQRFAEKESKLIDEKMIAKENERNLQERISILKSHLESADMAVATAASSADNEKSEISTQTQPTPKQACAMDVAAAHNREVSEVKESTVQDLKMQIEDLRTRLSMGAAAYTEKYMECHKLEKKMRKFQGQKTLPKVLAGSKQDSTTSDSQDDVNQKNANQASKETASLDQSKNDDIDEATSGGNFMSKLEQLFMAIADPDAEEQQQAKGLKIKLSELEKSVQFHHSKYRKYKQLYQDEKKGHAAHSEKSIEEVISLKREIVEMKGVTDALQYENQALKEQLNEFVINSQDANVLKTRSITRKAASTKSMTDENAHTEFRGSRYPHYSASKYPHEQLFTGQENIITRSGDSSSDSDLSDDFHMANTRFGAMGLCPKNQMSDDSDPIEISRPPIDIMPFNNTVINRQPTRSPPLIEVISDEGTTACSPTAVVDAKGGEKVESTRRRRNGKMKKSKIRKSYA